MKDRMKIKVWDDAGKALFEAKEDNIDEMKRKFNRWLDKLR